MRADGDLSYLADYWKNFSGHRTLIMRCTLKGVSRDFEEAEITLKTHSGNRTVGAAIRYGSGALILVPPIYYDSDTFIEQYDDNGEWEWSAEAVPPGEFGCRLSKSLVAVHRALQSEAGITPAPEWSSHSVYRLEQEDKLEEKIRANAIKQD